jgi:hypothetical protein
MKTKIIFHISILTILAVGLYACGKEDVEPQRSYEYEGEATAIRNDQQWNAEIRAFQELEPTLFSMQLRVYSGSILRESLLISNIRPLVNKYIINNKKSRDDTSVIGGRYYVMIDGDVVDDIYKIDEAQDNYITIDEFNRSTAKIKGTFQIYSQIEKDGRFTDSPSEVRFTSGEYETEVNPEWFE